MTQPFFVGEVYIGKKGEYVTIPDTVESCDKILNGAYDKRDAKEFYMIGKAKDY